MLIATDKSVTELISKYMKEIEKLKVRLIESEQMYQQLKKSTASTRNTKSIIPFGDTDGECITLRIAGFTSNDILMIF